MAVWSGITDTGWPKDVLECRDEVGLDRSLAVVLSDERRGLNGNAID